MTFFQNFISFIRMYVRFFVIPQINATMELVVPVGYTTVYQPMPTPIVLRAMLVHNTIIRKARHTSWISQLYRASFGGSGKIPRSSVVQDTLLSNITQLQKVASVAVILAVVLLPQLLSTSQTMLATTTAIIPGIFVRKDVDSFTAEDVRSAWMSPDINKKFGRYFRSPLFRDIGKMQLFHRLGLAYEKLTAYSIVRRLVYQTHAASVVTMGLEVNDFGEEVFTLNAEEGHTRGRLPGVFRVRLAKTETTFINKEGTAITVEHSVGIKKHQDPSGQVHEIPRHLPDLIEIITESGDEIESEYGVLVSADAETAYYMKDSAPAFVKTVVGAWISTKNAAKVTDLKVLLKRPGFEVEALNGKTVTLKELSKLVAAKMISADKVVDIYDLGRWIVDTETYNALAAEIGLAKAGYSPLQATVVFGNGAFFKGIIETAEMSGQAEGFYGGLKFPEMTKADRPETGRIVFASIMAVPAVTPWNASVSSQTFAYLDKKITERVFAPIGTVLTRNDAEVYRKATSGLFGEAFNTTSMMIAASAHLFRKSDVSGVAGQFGVRALGHDDAEFAVVTSDTKSTLRDFSKITWVDKTRMIFECAAPHNPALPVNTELDRVRVQIIEDERACGYFLALNIDAEKYIANIFMPVKGRDADGDGIVLTNDPRVLEVSTFWTDMKQLFDTTGVKAGNDTVVFKKLETAIGTALVRSAAASSIGVYDISAREVLATAPEIMTWEARVCATELIQMSISSVKKVIDPAQMGRRISQWYEITQSLRDDKRIGSESQNSIRMAQSLKTLVGDFNRASTDVVAARKSLRIIVRGRNSSKVEIEAAQEKLATELKNYQATIDCLKVHLQGMLDNEQLKPIAEAAIARMDLAIALRGVSEENPVGKIRAAVGRKITVAGLQANSDFTKIADIVGEMVNVWRGAEHATTVDEAEDNSSAPELYNYDAAADVMKTLFVAGAQQFGLDLMLAAVIYRRGASDRFVLASVLDSSILNYLKTHMGLKDQIVLPVLQKHVPKLGTILDNEGLTALGLPHEMKAVLDAGTKYRLAGVTPVEGEFDKFGSVRTVKNVLRLIESR